MLARSSFVRLIARFALLALGAFVAASLVPAEALAQRATVRVENPTSDEVDGRWRLRMVIDLGKPPDINYIPMVFSFTPTMLYERSLTDESPEKPVINKMPLRNQQSINESMDVGFSDGTGKTFKTTKFQFALRRDRGFEAGEYTLEVTRDGKPIAQKIRLVLNGDNPVVDRRSISFVGDSGKKPKKKEEPKDEAAPAPAPPSDGGDDDEEVILDGHVPPPEDLDGPPATPPKQGGCGCEVESPVDGPLGALGIALALALGAAGRRRAPPRPSC